MKIALLGYGIEGKSAYEYLRKEHPEASFTIYSNQPIAEPPGQVSVRVVDDFREIEADIVVRTPSIAPARISTTGVVTSVTKLFFEACPAPIIGVTASKGKGTIASLIASILRSAGKTTHLLGNIGVPALSELAKITAQDIVVYEMSSFQLWDMKKSPAVAVVGMIEPEHLDIHGTFEDYVGAKANITKWQLPTDFVVYHPTNEFSAQIAQLSPAKKARYASDEAAHFVQDTLMMDGNEICSVQEITIPGKHNQENICAAVSAAWAFTQDPRAVKMGVTSFTGLPHRIEFVRELDGVKYYDDSFASAPGASVVAVQSFSAPKIVILGGYDRGLDLSHMVQKILENNLKKALLVGQTSARLAELFQQLNAADRIENLGQSKMTEVVARARENATPGDVVLLSPGCASFDMFDNFKARGNTFKEAVRRL